MRHHNKNKKLGRKRNQRNALIKTLAVSLIMRGKIKTTITRAKKVRPYVERLVTYAKKKSVPSKRILISTVGKRASEKILDEITPRYLDRKGGYTRIIKSTLRAGDATQMAIIEFV